MTRVMRCRAATQFMRRRCDSGRRCHNYAQLVVAQQMLLLLLLLLPTRTLIALLRQLDVTPASLSDSHARQPVWLIDDRLNTEFTTHTN